VPEAPPAGVAVVGLARATVAAAVAVGTLETAAVGMLDVVGVVVFALQAATVASSPTMRTAPVILARVLGHRIIWTPPVGTHAEPSRHDNASTRVDPPSIRDRNGASSCADSSTGP
jgi:hypothetical protein